MAVRLVLTLGTVFAFLSATAAVVHAEEADMQMGSVVQFGSMHEAIGQQQHQGRVRFSDLLKRPNFYGVAALEGLRGEATVFNGQITVTAVDDQGRLSPVADAAAEMRATLLVGAYVDSWSEYPVPEDVAPKGFDAFVAKMANKAGLDLSKPFVFTVDGPVRSARLHVINGACPIHARIKQVELSKDVRPFELELPAARGTIVGVFAKDAVGKLTHPATSTHVHLLFTDPASKARVTGHVEQIGVGKGAVLRLPKHSP